MKFLIFAFQCKYYKPKQAEDAELRELFKKEDYEVKLANLVPGLRKNEQLYFAVLLRIMLNCTRYFLFLKLLYGFVDRIKISK